MKEMLMSVKNENAAGSKSIVLERPEAGGVYASLFEKINLNPVSELSALDSRWCWSVAICRRSGLISHWCSRSRRGAGFAWRTLRIWSRQLVRSCGCVLTGDLSCR
ncbi:hypothetical protein PANT111_160110 [Pantoea brenneri]|uniref:Uncharacterized protein n=1 Tax=Pantoea brenneri TaxID=472694 RepID=A0AAX3J484_9GAMM|nr:hypothetical protein PANT111_160110 [Pantoea brenneri]